MRVANEIAGMTAVPQTYMLDSNVFNDVLDGKMSLTWFAGCRLLVIGIQVDELRATGRHTPNPERRAALLKVFEEIRPTSTLASSFAFDIEGAGLDQASWNDGSGNFEKMLGRLRQLDTEKGKKKCHLNQLRDILIAETAIKNGATLVSGDCNLREVVSEFGGHSITLAQFSGS